MIKEGRTWSIRRKTFARVCTWNYSSLGFNVLSQGPIPGPSPVPGTTLDWGENSIDHVGVHPHWQYFNRDVNPAKYVWNVYLEFCHHQLTQIHEYDKSLILEHAIHREEDWEKGFGCLWKCLPCVKQKYTFEYFMCFYMKMYWSKIRFKITLLRERFNTEVLFLLKS